MLSCQKKVCPWCADNQYLSYMLKKSCWNWQSMLWENLIISIVKVRNPVEHLHCTKILLNINLFTLWSGRSIWIMDSFGESSEIHEFIYQIQKKLVNQNQKQWMFISQIKYINIGVHLSNTKTLVNQDHKQWILISQNK